MKSIIDKLDEVLIDTGKYLNKDELMKDALRCLLRAKPELKRELAVELYKKGTVSLSKAAEIYGSDMENFKELLKERGMKIVVPHIPSEEIDKEVDYLLSQ